MRMTVDPPRLSAAVEAVRGAGDVVASLTTGPLSTAVAALALAVPGSRSAGAAAGLDTALAQAAQRLHGALAALADDLQTAAAEYAGTEDRTALAARRATATAAATAGRP